MVQTRRKSSVVTTKTGKQISEAYCRKCCKVKKPTDFYAAVDLYLDGNGLMSICKSCCQQIYNENFESENSIERAMLKTCRTLNLKFDQGAIDAAKQQIETMRARGTESDNFFGLYKARLLTSQSLCIQSDRSGEDLTFYELQELPEPVRPLEDHEKNAEELKHFWGNKFEKDEYAWLEMEYSNWKIANPPANRNEETILKLVVLKLLTIRKEINLGHDTSKLEEGLTKLLTAGALSPAQANAANRGKMKDTFGEWVKEIEKTEPAEWWKNNSIYKDIDNIAEYWKIHILRPFLNFWGIQKDFNFDGAVPTGVDIDGIEDVSSSEE